MATVVEQAKFCNEKVRPVADRYCQLYYFAKAVLSEFVNSGSTDLIPNDSNVIDDNSSVDGRHGITGNQVNVLMAHLTTFVNDAEASGSLKLNQVSMIAVNMLP